MKRILLLWAVMALLLTACGLNDAPPEGSTPEPTALEGTYVSEYGSLTFTGDGRTVILDLSDDFAQTSGLPAGRSEGSYVFLFHNEEWRYDKAEYVRIIIDGGDYQFRNDLSSTNENTVSFFLDDGQSIRFEKED